MIQNTGFGDGFIFHWLPCLGNPTNCLKHTNRLGYLWDRIAFINLWNYKLFPLKLWVMPRSSGGSFVVVFGGRKIIVVCLLQFWWMASCIIRTTLQPVDLNFRFHLERTLFHFPIDLHLFHIISLFPSIQPSIGCFKMGNTQLYLFHTAFSHSLFTQLWAYGIHIMRHS